MRVRESTDLHMSDCEMPRFLAISFAVSISGCLSIYIIIAVSLGGDGSIVKAPEGYYRVHPPKVNVQNTIGCGDCFLSGFVYGLSEGYSIEDTIRIATAVSAATAESQLSAGYDLERAKELKEQVTIEKIK